MQVVVAQIITPTYTRELHDFSLIDLGEMYEMKVFASEEKAIQWGVNWIADVNAKAAAYADEHSDVYIPVAEVGRSEDTNVEGVTSKYILFSDDGTTDGIYTESTEKYGFVIRLVLTDVIE